MRTGLFFGSFNPVHLGHIAIANYFLEHGNLEEIWLIVSPQNPFKQQDELAPEKDRLEMVKLAINGHARLKACDIEFGLPRPSYTIDTLQELHRQYPKRTFVLLMGTDNLHGLPQWKEGETLRSQWPIYVYDRGEPPPEWLKNFPNIEYHHSPLLPLSATLVRNTVSAGGDLKKLLPEEVESYIREHKLYKK